MAEKQTILGRIAQLAKANINAILDKAEDPQKMIDQLIRDYTNSIVEAENAIAQTLGNLRMAEKDYEEDVKAAADWGQKAAAASAKADSLRAAGDEAGATKWDDLAKVAIGKQIQFENEVKTEEPALQAQREVAERLKKGLSQMKDKLSELKSRRDQLIAREKTAKAQAQVTDALSSINILDPTSELGRFEDRVRRQEALAQGKVELAASSLDAQFAELETDSSQIEIAARLAVLTGKAAEGPAASVALNEWPGGPARGRPVRMSRRRRSIPRARVAASQEGHRVEVVDVDDVEPGQAHLECVHIVFEVDDFQASFLQLVELGGEELLEAHDRDAAALVQERLDLGQEVGVVAGQDDVARADLRDRVHRALQADVNDLHVGGTRQGDHRVVHRRQGLDESHGQEARGAVEEEQALGALAPAAVRALQDTIPAGAFLGVGAAIQDRQAERGVDILAVDDEVCRLIIRVFHGVNCRCRGGRHCRPWVLGAFRQRPVSASPFTPRR